MGITTPEYLATQLRSLSVDDIRKRWGKVNEKRLYKGNVIAHIGRIDNERELVIKTESALGATYGEFIGINKKDCPIWSGAKLNYRTKGSWPGSFAGSELYEYVDGLIQLSQASGCGITTKDIWYNPNTGRFSLANHQHIYPHMGEGLHNSLTERQMVHKAYDKGKKLWKDKFTINADDRGTGNLKAMLDAIENVELQPVGKVYQ